MVGLNFHPGSKRYVECDEAVRIAESLPAGVWCVGVFVDRSREEIEQVRGRVRLDAIQLHGDEPAEMLRGWPVQVFSRGRRVVDDGRLLAAPGDGRFVAREATDAMKPAGREVPEMAQLRAWGTPFTA